MAGTKAKGTDGDTQETRIKKHPASAAQVNRHFTEDGRFAALADRRAQALDLAKRSEAELVWATAGIEVRSLTLEQTKQILVGQPSDGMSAANIRVVLNTRRAWGFLLENADWQPDWMTVSHYNTLVGTGLIPDAGRLRTFSVRISGTDWTPEIPTPENSMDEVTRINNDDEQPADRAITLLLAIMRGQWFRDGNKRTALLAANHSLIHDGIGMIEIRKNDRGHFIVLLTDFYANGNDRRIRAWLGRNAIVRPPAPNKAA